MSGKVAADGVALIAAERQRQIDQEGYTPGQDMVYNQDQLSRAAVAYLSHDTVGLPPAARSWPWSRESFKPSPREPHDGYWTAANIAARVRDLTKAGALVAAEIDRLQGLQAARAEARL